MEEGGGWRGVEGERLDWGVEDPGHSPWGEVENGSGHLIKGLVGYTGWRE